MLTALTAGVNGVPSFCFLFGTQVPFDAQTLDALHPNHGSYLDPVQQVVKENLGDGDITPHAAQQTIRGAAQPAVGN